MLSFFIKERPAHELKPPTFRVCFTPSANTLWKRPTTHLKVSLGNAPGVFLPNQVVNQN